jgi:hypothetical protein
MATSIYNQFQTDPVALAKFCIAQFHVLAKCEKRMQFEAQLTMPCAIKYEQLIEVCGLIATASVQPHLLNNVKVQMHTPANDTFVLKSEKWEMSFRVSEGKICVESVGTHFDDIFLRGEIMKSIDMGLKSFSTNLADCVLTAFKSLEDGQKAHISMDKKGIMETIDKNQTPLRIA